MPTTLYSEKEWKRKEKECDALRSVVDTLDKMLLPEDRRSGNDKSHPKCFGYIPYCNAKFLSLMMATKVAYSVMNDYFRSKPKTDPRPQKRKNHYVGKFLDVGCGIGTKLVLANEFYEVDGLEINKNYVEIAKRSGRKIHHEDALKFQHYDNYDIIYFYRPMCDEKKQVRLEAKIYTSATPGTIILPVYCVSCPTMPCLIGEGSNKDAIYVKDVNEEVFESMKRAIKRECSCICRK